jgi:uncharacterized protein YbbC (DUF1343 family)
MAHLSTAQHYPGSCLIEGTSLSEGRGTALPFEIVGAPYVDAGELAAALNALALAGVRVRPHVFTPTASKYAGETCYGVQAHITDWGVYHQIEVWLTVLTVMYQRYGFEWNTSHFDRLIGSDVPRQLISANQALDPLFAEWRGFCEDFRRSSQPFWLYT